MLSDRCQPRRATHVVLQPGTRGTVLWEMAKVKLEFEDAFPSLH
jgi:hypothetical protein